jgi:hypothetical protein
MPEADQPSRRASSVISGTPASALETGQFSLCSVGRGDEGGLVDTRNRADHRERDLRDPSPGWKVTVAEVFSSSAGLPA